MLQFSWGYSHFFDKLKKKFTVVSCIIMLYTQHDEKKKQARYNAYIRNDKYYMFEWFQHYSIIIIINTECVLIDIWSVQIRYRR